MNTINLLLSFVFIKLNDILFEKFMARLRAVCAGRSNLWITSSLLVREQLGRLISVEESQSYKSSITLKC